MKSKKKMLLALGAMSAAAIGAGATSTFAWYTANAASVTKNQAITGALSTQTSTLDAGSFTVTYDAPTNNAAIGPVCLTTATGTTFVKVGNQVVPATLNGDGYASVAVSVTVTYSGEETDNAKIKQLWAAAIAANGGEITSTTTCTAAAGTSVEGGEKVAATSDVRFLAGAPANAAGWAGDASNGVLTSSGCANWTFSNKVSSGNSLGTIYVAVTGHDDVSWTGADAAHRPSYTLTFQLS